MTKQPHYKDSQARAEERLRQRYRRSPNGWKGLRQREAIASFTGCLAILTICVALLQTCISRGQLIEMRSEQRPWISIYKVEFSSQSPDTAKIVFKNIGHTPTAKGFVSDAIIISGRDNIKTDIESRCHGIEKFLHGPQNNLSALPDSEWLVPITEMPSKMISGIKSPVIDENKEFFIVGCAVYRSPIDTKLHHTGFYAAVNKTGKGVLSVPYVYTQGAD